MSFLAEWVVFYAAVMFAMSVDNIFWIPASPEYQFYRRWNFGKKIKYIMKDRVLAVLTHWRDIVPAVMTSFLLAVIF